MFFISDFGFAAIVLLFGKPKKKHNNDDTLNNFCFESSHQVALKLKWMNICFGKTIVCVTLFTVTFFVSSGRPHGNDRITRANWNKRRRKKEKKQQQRPIDQKLLISMRLLEHQVHKYYFFIVAAYYVNEATKIGSSLWFNCLNMCGYGSRIECLKYAIKMFHHIWNTLLHIACKPSSLEKNKQTYWRADYIECDLKHFTNSHFTIYAHYLIAFIWALEKPPSSDYSNKEQIKMKHEKMQ